jgi:hypothetical protein
MGTCIGIWQCRPAIVAAVVSFDPAIVYRQSSEMKCAASPGGT